MVTPFRDDAFAERRVVVTGGSSGIGLAIVDAFTNLGAEVTVADLARADAPPAATSGVTLVDVDVTNPKQINELFSTFGAIDVLVNCAGVIRRRDEYLMENFQAVLDVNLVGTMRTCIGARAALEEAGGCIVNIASMTSLFASNHAPAYGASKAAVAQLTKSLAVELAPHVRVNAVAPGWIRTRLTGPVEDDPEMNRRILERTPFGRWGLPEEVSGAVVFLSSPAAAFITGVLLSVDGGYSGF